jgi:hypothetical protein
MERSANLLTDGGHMGLITPLASVGVAKSDSLRAFVSKKFEITWYSNYGFRPSKLFDGVNLRLSIWLARKGAYDQNRYSTRYALWNHEERGNLFSALNYKTVSVKSTTLYPKVGDDPAKTILEKISSKSEPLGFYLARSSVYGLHYHRSPLYWIRAMDFEPYFKSDTKERSVHHFRDVYGRDLKSAKCVGAILNSSLFYFVFGTTGNCRNLTGDDVNALPVGILEARTSGRLVEMFDELMTGYKSNSDITVRYNCEYQTFYPSKSKSVLDEIDGALATHYGFTPVELDYIINYDVKYRMGASESEESEED